MSRRLTGVALCETIALEVMGWARTTFEDGSENQKVWPCYTIESDGRLLYWHRLGERGVDFRPDLNMNQAWWLVERLRSRGWDWAFIWNHGKRCKAQCCQAPSGDDIHSIADDMQNAICLATLEAVHVHG